MCREESQSVLTRAKECSSSVFGLDDTHSFISENTANISVMFDFDTIILGSRIYQQAERSHLRQAIRARDGRRDVPTMETVAADDANTIISIRDERVDRAADRRREGDSNDQSGYDEPVPTGSPDRQALNSQDTTSTPERLPSLPHEQAIDTSVVLSSSESAQSVGSARQPSNFRLRNWLRMPPRRKDARDSLKNIPTPNILILGSSESGKSTLLKALTFQERQYSLDERLCFREIIWINVVQGTRIVLEAMEVLELSLEDASNEYHAQTIFMQPIDYNDCPPPEVIRAIQILWRDAGFQEAFRRRREYQLNESFRDYAVDIERLLSPDYVPTNGDILRSRVKTTGITDTTFSYEDRMYRILDVGGTRSERKKWIHGFNNVSTVVFTIDAHNYAKLLFEDETVNRMQEQLDLFESVVNSRWFQRSSFVIVFTKMDMVEEWLQTEPVDHYFPDYSRDFTMEFVESYMQYLEKRFEQLILSEAVLKRTLMIRKNLVDDSSRPGLQIWRILRGLAYSTSL
jgi:guanine nucleotide-binding protein G(i) subunit alpha